MKSGTPGVFQPRLSGKKLTLDLIVVFQGILSFPLFLLRDNLKNANFEENRNSCYSSIISTFPREEKNIFMDSKLKTIQEIQKQNILPLFINVVRKQLKFFNSLMQNTVNRMKKRKGSSY